jgi:PAS domain S-box-containing protein
MLGYTYEEIIGKNFINDIFINEHNTNGLLKIPHNRRGLLLSEQYEIAIKKKNGEKVWVIVNNHPIINDGGKKIGAMGTLVNITDRKKVEERLKKVNEELKTFIYRTSHDLRGPLASVLGITNLATMEITDPRALQYFSYINKSTQKLDKTLKALIDVASITQPDEEYTAVDFKELITEVIDTLNYTNMLENMSILLEVDQHTSFISSKQLLTYVFEKLIENAICYRKEDIADPKLSIQINVTKEEAKIEIKDNGIGIPKELQQKVFNMFFKGVEKSRGSGLGLYVVDKLVSSLNGTIELESELNVGTHFTIRLKSI